MKMEVLVQQQYQSQYGVLGSNKVKDWTSTLTPPTSSSTTVKNSNNKMLKSKSEITGATTIVNNSNPPYLQSNTTNKMRNSINKNKINRTVEVNNTVVSNNKTRMGQQQQQQFKYTSYDAHSNSNPTINNNNNTMTMNMNNVYCDDINAARVNELSLRLLDVLRAAKSRHLTCTEVSLPCDLTPRIAADIIRASNKEPCGIRGCTIYIEFEDEPNNSRRIATLKLDPETVSTFEVYLTLRQDHRGWTSLLPQFMKSLARTITISPKFTITKHKLYTPYQSSNSYGGIGNTISNSIAITATAATSLT